MALASRGTRRITVDGVQYRWVVAPDDGYMVLVVEPADGLGQRLEVRFGYDDVVRPAGAGSYHLVGQSRSISPGTVRAVLLTALGGGWQASRKGLAPYRVNAESLVRLDPPAD